MNMTQKAFVLVHGGHAGAWVWDDVRSLLSLPAIAIDLPGHGAKPGDLRTLTFAECAQAAVAELPASRRIILVGHSLGAAVVLSMLEYLVDRLDHVVVVAGPVPRPGTSIVNCFPFFMRVASHFVLAIAGPTFAAGRRVTEHTLLNGLSSAKARQACDRMTLESSALVREPLRWSGRVPVPCTYIKCLRDRGPLSPRHQDRMAMNLGDRVRIVTVDACHYAMLERPSEIAAILNQLVATDCRDYAEPSVGPSR